MIRNMEQSLIDWDSHPMTKVLKQTLSEIKDKCKDHALSVQVLDATNRDSQLNRLFGKTQIIDTILNNEFVEIEED